ncbi:hypothetical protein M9Y10_024378 [Tritrichomonas musculus]|uniref:Ankyrin repeat protein n=1 Tax=Tritrichomonas musculus TaxID=1915356 RepID=A0ABR2HCR2_9EUKA
MGDDQSNYNKTLTISNYKLPKILNSKPTYSSLCAFFSAEQCLEELSLLDPSGFESDEMNKLDNNGRSPIHFACIGGNLNIIRQLEQGNVDLNAKDNEGCLPSHYAATVGNFDVIKYLWVKGADIFSPSLTAGMTPLQNACFYGNIEIVKFICGIIQEMKESQPELFEKIFLLPSKNSTLLHYACMGGHEHIVEYLLSNPEISQMMINAIDGDSRTPLICSCQNGSLNCVKCFFNKNGKLNAKKKSKKHLPLVAAAENGHLDIVHFLLNQKSIHINQETSSKRTALEAAVLKDHFDVVKYLIEKGSAKSYDKERIGTMFLDAVGTEDFQLIKYLDEVFTIPYESVYSFKREIYRNITWGSRYMNQACYLENKELVDFLYSKGCSFKNVDLRYSINEESFEFIEFLFQKRFDFSREMNPPLLYYIVKLGTLEQAKELASIEGVCNDKIIVEHKLLYRATLRGDPKLCEFLMSFIPDHFSNDVHHEIENSLIYAVINCPPTKNKINKYLEIITIMLDKITIDFNSYINYDDTYISLAAYKKNFKLLEIVEEHGADLSNLSIKFQKYV